MPGARLPVYPGSFYQQPPAKLSLTQDSQICLEVRHADEDQDSYRDDTRANNRGADRRAVLDIGPCESDELGRVVAIVLHNFAIPLIRYDTGDHTELGEPYPCGKERLV